MQYIGQRMLARHRKEKQRAARKARKLRLIEPEELAKEIVAVQPIPEVDWLALSQHPLFQSFFERHFGENHR